MSDFTCEIHADSMIAALARLKKIPVSKVIRNAGRDFARAAQAETPEARTDAARYYKYWDKRAAGWKYLRADDVEETYVTRTGRTRTKARKWAKDRFEKLRKVPIHRLWSKASWIGVFRALGLPPKGDMKTGKLPQEVNQLSQATQTATDYYSEMTIDDAIHFDRFGRNYSAAEVERIAKAGYEAAAKNITAETERMLEKQWKGAK